MLSKTELVPLDHETVKGMPAVPTHQWNASTSMRSVLVFPNGKTPRGPAARIVPPAADAEARNPVNKSVAAPASAPSVLTRKRKTDQSYASNDVFGAPIQTSAQSGRSSQLHTDPFDGSRQSGPRNMYASYGAFPRSDPHPTGMRHCQPIEPQPRNQFVSATGAISNGGRRHTSPCREAQLMDADAAGSRPKSPVGRRCLSPAAVNPITEGGSNVLRPQPVSPARKRSPTRDQPTLVGVLYREKSAEPVGFMSRAPWHLNTPRDPPSQVSPQVLRPWEKLDSNRRVNEPLNTTSSAPTTVASRKTFHSVKVKAPFHTNTPREASNGRELSSHRGASASAPFALHL